MTHASDANETHEIAELLFALVGQTAVQGERCASECGVSIVQASVLLSIQDDMSMRELATRQGGHASNATGIADRLAARGLIPGRTVAGSQLVAEPEDPRRLALGLVHVDLFRVERLVQQVAQQSALLDR